MHRINIACHWWDHQASGVVCHTITAQHPLSHYTNSPIVGRGAGGDKETLIKRGYCSDEGARQAVNRVQRTIQFMDLTGAKNSRAYVQLFGRPGTYRHHYPCRADHTLIWRVNGRYVVTTEPYHLQPKLADWCAEHDWTCAHVEGFGMWYPEGDTQLYLLAPPRIGADVEGVRGRLYGVTPWTL